MFGIQKIVSHVACPIGADAGNPQGTNCVRVEGRIPNDTAIVLLYSSSSFRYPALALL